MLAALGLKNANYYFQNQPLNIMVNDLIAIIVLVDLFDKI